MPDGAIEVLFDTAGTVTFDNYAGTSGGAVNNIDLNVAAGDIVRTLGQVVKHSAGAKGLFFLAGL